jgi:hypothetical protein
MLIIETSAKNAGIQGKGEKMSERKKSYTVSPEAPTKPPTGQVPTPPPGPEKLDETLTKQDLVEQILMQSKTILSLVKQINRLENEIRVRKEMMEKYADMCEGYRKMNDGYQEMIDYYKQPLKVMEL